MTLAQEHNASTMLVHYKLGDKMEGRFNQDLPESLQATFEKAANFEPCILTKQTINTRRMNKINQIDVSPCDDEFEVNKAHVRNPNYKGKNYDPNYQNRNKNNINNNSSNSCSNAGTVQVQVTLTGPVNRDQLFKIQEVLRHSS